MGGWGQGGGVGGREEKCKLESRGLVDKENNMFLFKGVIQRRKHANTTVERLHCSLLEN